MSEDLKPQEAPVEEKKIELTDDQKKLVLDRWNDKSKPAPALKELIELVFGAGFDGRSFQGKAVKEYLASRSLRARPANEYQKKEFELTEDQKEFIRNNSNSMKPLEMARTLFSNQELQALDIRARAVVSFYNTIDPSVRLAPPEETREITDYKQPKNHTMAIARINKYVYDKIDPAKITQKEKSCFDALIKYMHVHRFIYMMNSFDDVRDRELFESSFVRFTNDKPDLTEEEIDLYLNLCSDIVAHSRMQRSLNQLEEAKEDSMAESGKISMTIVEAIGKSMGEMDSNLKRQKNTLENLQGKRSDRLGKKLKDNASLLNLIELWKSEETRKRIILLAEARQKDMEKEVDRLSDMDALKFELFGMSKEEVLN